MPHLSIGEIAKRAGVRASAIRYYEKIGLLPKTARLNGRRYYDESTLERLAIMRFAKRVGFSIAELRILLKDTPRRPPPERWRELAHEKLTQLDQLITEASAVRQTLLETLDQKCPKLVERGQSLRPSGSPLARAKAPSRASSKAKASSHRG
jgi:MerR family redox-sensitive transcriptional activator SoxR